MPVGNNKYKEPGMRKEVVISRCFTSGHKFYSARLGATVYQGFLCPGDKFEFSKLSPKKWWSVDGEWLHTNFSKGADVPSLEEFHEATLKKFKTNPPSLPSRLRKYFK